VAASIRERNDDAAGAPLRLRRAGCRLRWPLERNGW